MSKQEFELWTYMDLDANYITDQGIDPLQWMAGQVERSYPPDLSSGSGGEPR